MKRLTLKKIPASTNAEPNSALIADPVKPVKKKAAKTSRLDQLCNEMTSMNLSTLPPSSIVQVKEPVPVSVLQPKKEKKVATWYQYVPIFYDQGQESNEPPIYWNIHTQYIAKSLFIPKYETPPSHDDLDWQILPIQWHSIDCYVSFQTSNKAMIDEETESSYIHIYTMYPDIQYLLQLHGSSPTCIEYEEETFPETLIPQHIMLPKKWHTNPLYLTWFLHQICSKNKIQWTSIAPTSIPWWKVEQVVVSDQMKETKDTAEHILDTYRKRRLEEEEYERMKEEERSIAYDATIEKQQSIVPSPIQVNIPVVSPRKEEDPPIEETPKKPSNHIPPPMAKKTLTLKKKSNVIPPKKTI
jgi:hypothetical protein